MSEKVESVQCESRQKLKMASKIGTSADFFAIFNFWLDSHSIKAGRNNFIGDHFKYLCDLLNLSISHLVYLE